MEYLRRTYGNYATYVQRRGGWPGAKRFEDLLGKDLSERDRYETLHADDAAFYQLMWSDVTAFFAREIRRHDAKGLILSYRFIRVQRWPDPWLKAALRGIGPHVDAFVPELYGDDPYREIVDGIGALTGKPVVIGDGMRIREFTYPDEADDVAEAASYRKMYLSLLASPWFLGGSVCEYRDKKPNNAYYSPRPGEARTGVRRPDYGEREALRRVYEELHGRKSGLRMELMAGR